MVFTTDHYQPVVCSEFKTAYKIWLWLFVGGEEYMLFHQPLFPNGQSLTFYSYHDNLSDVWISSGIAGVLSNVYYLNVDNI